MRKMDESQIITTKTGMAISTRILYCAGGRAKIEVAQERNRTKKNKEDAPKNDGHATGEINSEHCD